MKKPIRSPRGMYSGKQPKLIKLTKDMKLRDGGKYQLQNGDIVTIKEQIYENGLRSLVGSNGYYYSEDGKVYAGGSETTSLAVLTEVGAPIRKCKMLLLTEKDLKPNTKVGTTYQGHHYIPGFEDYNITQEEIEDAEVIIAVLGNANLVMKNNFGDIGIIRQTFVRKS